jgi:uncharacterized protein (TIGR03435 family)
MAAHLETKEVPIYILRTIEGGAMKPASGDSGGGRGMSGLKMQSTVGAFAIQLSDYIKRPVFDETGMDGTFDLSLFWKKGNPESLQEVVKQQLGLQLVDDKRSLELLIVDHIEKLQFPK